MVLNTAVRREAARKEWRQPQRGTGREGHLEVLVAFELGEQLPPEAVHVRAGGALVVATDQKEVSWQQHLPAGQHQQGLQTPGPPVHKVTCR